MITAGTVAAYLTLSTDDFSAGIGEAMALLRSFGSSASESGGEIGALRSVLETVAGSVKGIFTPALSFASSQGSSAISALSSSVQGGVSSINSSLSFAAASAKGSGGAMGSAMKSASGVVSAAMSAAVSSILGFSAGAVGAKAASEKVKSGILSPFSTLGSSLSALMRNAGASMASALQSRASGILAVAQSIASGVISTIKNALQIASPSKVMLRLGAYTGKGLALGIAAQRPEVIRQARLLAEAAQSGAATGTIAANISQGQQTLQNAPAAVDLGGIDSRLERLIELLSSSEQTIQVDGRAFGRLVREYA